MASRPYHRVGRGTIFPAILRKSMLRTTHNFPGSGLTVVGAYCYARPIEPMRGTEMTALSATAVRDLAREAGLPDHLAEEIADDLAGDGFADEALVVFAVGQALDEIREG